MIQYLSEADTCLKAQLNKISEEAESALWLLHCFSGFGPRPLDDALLTLLEYPEDFETYGADINPTNWWFDSHTERHLENYLLPSATKIEIKHYFSCHLALLICRTLERATLPAPVAAALGHHLHSLRSEIANFDRLEIRPNNVFEALIKSRLRDEPEIGNVNLALDLVTPAELIKEQSKRLRRVILVPDMDQQDSNKVVYQVAGETRSTTRKTLENQIAKIRTVLFPTVTIPIGP